MKIRFKIKFALTFCLVAIFAFTSCKKEVTFKGYTVTGTVKGLDEATIKLIELDFTDRGSKPKVIDSTQMINGAFTFKGIVEHPDRVSITIGDEFNSTFFLENSTIALNFDTTESNRGELKAKVTGSALEEIYDVQQTKIDSIMNQEKFAILKTIRSKMEEAYKSKDDAKIKAIQEYSSQFKGLQSQQQNERRSFMIQYAKDYPESAVAPWILGFQFSEGRMSKEEMKTIYPIFKGDAKHTAMFKYYEKTYNDIFKSLGEGAIAPDFKLNDANGKEIVLSKINAKYKLVDFWASWCVPCRSSFPHLKELYKAYGKDGFEIVGIGTADDEEKWRKAIEEDQTPWMHLNDTGADHQYGVVARQYGVPFLPTTFLMDENEKIILRNPKKSELDEKLKELFGY
ncbi:TlpA disulfide reductase family protein [Polaribacter vadi]|uniref:TlpA disulfide reductase family protein n=1 Tax=Polaribacter vadi TaxID=1774273 RepID=UPI0030EC5262|tara:strand:+ start:39641 stop:40837 length:1197 start_codon:yes stop_codon:yes gene_type:complete